MDQSAQWTEVWSALHGSTVRDGQRCSPVSFANQSPKFAVADLWQEKRKVTANGWGQMSTTSKTLDFARGCNSIHNQLVKFSYFARFGTVRLEVRIRFYRLKKNYPRPSAISVHSGN